MREGFKPGLEGLRGVAILLVLGFHTQLLPGGWIGVDVFFVLSGYLITGLLIESGIDLPHFYLRRVRRLVPAMLAMLLGVAFVVAPLAGAHIQRSTLLTTGGYAANLSYGDIQPFGHMWSLAQEEQFYLVWPLLLVAMLACGRRVASIGSALLAAASATDVVLLAASGASVDRLYFAPDTHALPMLFGCTLALSAWKPSRPMSAVLAGGGSLVTVALLSSEHTSSSVAYLPAALLTPVCGVALVVGALAFPDVFVWPLRRLGLYSYGIYLWHYPLIHWLPDIPAVALAVALAVASYHLIEAPLRGLLKRPGDNRQVVHSVAGVTERPPGAALAADA